MTARSAAVAAESAVLIALDRLRPAVWNANRVPAATMAKIRRSIERFGFVEGLVARAHPTEHGGSGTTLVAAEQTGRRAFLVELDPGYCDVIRARYEQLASGRPPE